MKQWIVFGLMLVSVISVAAATQNDAAFQSGHQFANQRQLSAELLLNQTKASQVPGYKTDNPPQTQYDESRLNAIAQQKVKGDSTAQFMYHSFNERHHIQLNKKNEPFIQKTNQTMAMANLVAGDLNTACPDGSVDCHAQRAASPDFNQAVSSLSATADASKDFTKNQIFRGKRGNCRQDGFDYNDCCEDEGWGQDLHLAGCDNGEKALGAAKEAGLCHRMGSFCSNEILGVCLSHKQSYCCFTSKLARLIQEQGRKQLKKGWGSAESPNCGGFSPEELQRIDFSKINFTAFYSDIQKKQQLPNVANTQQHVKERVTQFYEQGKPS